MKIIKALVLGASVLVATPALAGWKSVDDQSRVAFGSVKGEVSGEVHHFNRAKGHP